MAAVKRLLKERAKIARDPIPYVTFQGDDDDEKMSDDAVCDINQWRFVLALDPAHDSLDDASEIGKAADSPYCRSPSSSSSSGKSKSGGLLSGVTRAAKSSKKSSNDTGGQQQSSSHSASGGRTVYFAFQMDFPPNYPFKPPTITVLSNTYHPNVKKTTGEMCDSVLTGDGWGPTLNVRKICMRLRKFLCDPDPDHPLEGEMAQLLMEKPGEYGAAAFKHAAEYGTRVRAEEAMARGKQKK
eukprot:CAMPEP_0181108424 /NCGR_PEP_ID=MMETSP1071-20121207/17623_1 /TAXON_ID=35127 /ORGANISM="Thalassiosira sp., Strain NH16" /LENGTH=240 /DNA_ID=CAMNT_0023192027 /DNA_START=17 /DNA_END=739 /DNA_ORIENTATION=+